MGFFFGRNKGTGIPKYATFRLTQEGKAKLDTQFTGDPKGRILMALDARGTSDLDELTETTGLSRGQVERFIQPLVRGGYIQYVSANMGAEVE